MIEVKFKIEGMDGVKEALRALPDTTSKNVLRRVGRLTLAPFAADARAGAPIEWGDLRDSITVSTTLSRRQRGKFEKLGPHDVEVFAGAGALPQAHITEFGKFDQPPRAFMRAAWDRNRLQMVETFSKLIWTEIEKATKRADRKAAKASGGDE
jgi:HK97 gp10 family phage protein